MINKSTAKYRNVVFFITLFTTTFYEFFLTLINPVGISFIKVIITLFLWVSCILSISTFLSVYRKIRLNLSRSSFYIFSAIIVWNLFSILRSTLGGHEPLTTVFGNNVTSLALLVPFSLAFSMEKRNLRIINNFFIGFITIGVLAFVFFFASSKGRINNIFYDKSLSVIFWGVFFLIPIIPFQLNKGKFIIVFGSIVLSYLATITEYRIMIVRIMLLYLSIFAMYFYRKFNLKLIIYIALFSLILPFYFLMESVVTGVSAFQKYSSETSNEDLTEDSRTFLYIEVYDDLRKNNQLLIGKGSSEPYYSPYFDEYGGDTSQRLSVEVGIMALLLKGGLIAVILNLSIFFIAIFHAFFRTNNYFVMSVGFMLIIHVLILFISNFIDYTIYNVALWFFVGLCLSKEFRSLDNIQINNILKYGRFS